MKNALNFAVWATLWITIGAQYLGEEELDPLQKTAVIGGSERNLDQIGSTIETNKTSTHLNCASGYMNIGVTFRDPFFGIIYPNGSRTSACLIHGTGDTHYVIDLPLKGCGTKRVERRVFVNNIIVRFHKGLELEGDEVKTIICRYPSPEVLPPPAPPLPILAPAVPPTPISRVGEVEILMIVCAIVFLALLLVGMACSYTCLKKRNIRIVRTRPLSMGPPSEMSKMSGSSLIFDGLKIPRAHATTSSDSDTAMVSQSETLPSDYPSESPSSGSEVEEVEVIEDDRISSVYSDAYVQSEAEIVAAHQMLKPPMPTCMIRVKKAPTPPRTPEPDYSLQNALSQSLTTILENDESFRAESLPGSEHALMMTESEAEFYPGPDEGIPPPLEHVQRTRQERFTYAAPPAPSDVESVVRSESEAEMIVATRPPPRHFDMKQIDTTQLIQQEITDVEENINKGKRRYMAPPPVSEPDSDYPSEARSVTDTVEDLTVAVQPELTMHTVDDRYLSTITETNVTEDVQKHRRYVKQYHMKPKAPPPPPKWNVNIRHYPGPKYADENESSGPEWEAYSEPGSDVFRSQMMKGADDNLSQIEVDMLEHPPPPNWTALIRVLEPPPTERAVREVLTHEDREKWRQIITTESTLRTMLTTATVREDYERIRRDQRYEKLFEPKKWDVIIRILSPPTVPRHSDETSSETQSMSDAESLPSRDGKRYRKYDPPAATGGKKVNLPPVYEYDASGNPIIKKTPGPVSTRSRRSSKSSMVSGADVRSIPETEVNFSRPHDTWSETSGPSTSGARSHADRSHSEITFNIPAVTHEEYTDTDYDDRLSARTGRSLVRSASEFTEDWRHQDQIERYSQSSNDSRPHRQTERSTSEYMEEAPHLSDFPTSPEGSPHMVSRRAFQSARSGTDNQGYMHEENYQYETQGSQGQRIVTSGYRSTASGYSGYVVDIPEEDELEAIEIEYPDKRKKPKK